MAVTSGYATVAQSQSIKEDSNDIWEPKKWGLISSTATSFNIPSTKTKDPNGCIPFVLKNTSGADVTVQARGIYDDKNVWVSLVVFNGQWNLEPCLEIRNSDGTGTSQLGISGLYWGTNR